MREFQIQISPTGEVQIHLEGYQGKACLEAVQQFEAWIGSAREVTPTSEFYAPEDEVTIRDQQHC